MWGVGKGCVWGVSGSVWCHKNRKHNVFWSLDNDNDNVSPVNLRSVNLKYWVVGFARLCG